MAAMNIGGAIIALSGLGLAAFSVLFSVSNEDTRDRIIMGASGLLLFVIGLTFL